MLEVKEDMCFYDQFDHSDTKYTRTISTRLLDRWAMAFREKMVSITSAAASTLEHDGLVDIDVSSCIDSLGENDAEWRRAC